MVAYMPPGTMIARPFCNNLRRGDRVMHADTKLVGTVARDPGETKREVYVLFSGYERAKKVDVMELRFVDSDGKVEADVAPIDGDPPEFVGRKKDAAPAARGEVSAIETLRAERAQIQSKMDAISVAHKNLRESMERIDKAIAIMTSP